MIYRFGHYVLDTAGFELRRRGSQVNVEPTVLRLLQYLIENRDRVVSRSELHNKLWNERIVTDNALTARIRSARRIVGDSGQAQAVIRTIHGAGYRFVAQVESVAQTSIVTARQSAGEQPGSLTPLPDGIADRALTGQPSIAVLPFESISGEDGEIVFARGLAHDLITRIARSRTMLITARGSAFRFAGGNQDIVEVGRKLGVRYIVQGAVQIASGRLKVSVALANSVTCEEVWSDQFTRKPHDFMLVQEEIAEMIVGSLESSVQQEEVERSLLLPSSNLDAWSTYHRGLHHMFRFRRADCDRAERFFRRSIELEPNVPRAYAGLSFVHFQRVFMRFETDRSAGARRALDYAERSLSIDPLDPMGHFVLARARLLEAQLGASRDSLETAIALNPSYAAARYSLGWVQMQLGENEKCTDLINSARLLSPFDPLIYAMQGVLALNLALTGQSDEALQLARQSLRQPNAHYIVAAFGAVTHALCGEKDRARHYWDLVRRADPDYGMDYFMTTFPFRRESDTQRIRKVLDEIHASGPPNWRASS